jgi:Patatin-like phospholipase
MEIGINKKEHKHKGQLGGRADNSSNLKRINLALQGGGSHGAFAWGVLDRLLEDDCIDFDGISATSVGAVNATVLAYGLAVGGRAGARHAGGHLARRCQSCFAQPSTADPVRPVDGQPIARNIAGLRPIRYHDSVVFALPAQPLQHPSSAFDPLRYGGL